jgi:hypothetical protein
VPMSRISPRFSGARIEISDPRKFASLVLVRLLPHPDGWCRFQILNALPWLLSYLNCGAY